MAYLQSPSSQQHVRSGRYAQRERPAATIPSRLASKTGRPARHAATLVVVVAAGSFVGPRGF